MGISIGASRDMPQFHARMSEFRQPPLESGSRRHSRQGVPELIVDSTRAPDRQHALAQALTREIRFILDEQNQAQAIEIRDSSGKLVRHSLETFRPILPAIRDAVPLPGLVVNETV